MANPLDTGLPSTGGRDLKPGETRTFPAKDKQGNVVKTITVLRTDRNYVFDLCDAYNQARTREAEDRGVEWFVAANGELRIGTADAWSRANFKQIESRKETERARHNRLQLEAARAANAYQREDAE